MHALYLKFRNSFRAHLAMSARKAEEKRQAEQEQAAEREAASGASDTAGELFKEPRLRVDFPHVKRTSQRDQREAPKTTSTRITQICNAVEQWQHLRHVGIDDFRKEDFVKVANRWSIGCMKILIKSTEPGVRETREHLLKDLPAQFKPASDDMIIGLKDMVEKHDGELREIQGAWEEHQGAVPTQEAEPNLYNCQFAINSEDYEEWKAAGKGKGKGKGKRNSPERPPPEPHEKISSILKMSASGDQQYLARSAQVVGLGELLLFFSGGRSLPANCMSSSSTLRF